MYALEIAIFIWKIPIAITVTEILSNYIISQVYFYNEKLPMIIIPTATEFLPSDVGA